MSPLPYILTYLCYYKKVFTSTYFTFVCVRGYRDMESQIDRHGGGLHVLWLIYGCRKTTCRNWFSYSTLFILQDFFDSFILHLQVFSLCLQVIIVPGTNHFYVFLSAYEQSSQHWSKRQGNNHKNQVNCYAHNITKH